MRIICWNVRRASVTSAAWDYLLECAPDLALLQEVGGLPDSIRQHYTSHADFPAGKKGMAQKFSTMILARGSIGLPIQLRGSAAWVNSELERFSGNLVANDVLLDAGTLLKAVSVYSPAWPVDRSRLVGIDVQDVRLIQNPDVWVADLLWTLLRDRALSETEAWVVAGDFNSSETFDLWRTQPRGNLEYLNRMADLGLVECLRHSMGSLTPTYRNTDKVTVKHQMDHLFVTRVLANRLVSCYTGSQETIFDGNLSDHLPIIADFKD